jgi:hypothetical protein
MKRAQVWHIASPRVLELARSYFGCGTLEALPGMNPIATLEKQQRLSMTGNLV